MGKERRKNYLEELPSPIQTTIGLYQLHPGQLHLL